MSILVITALSLHALAAVFWAGATFVLARNPDFGAEKWLRPQMIAALIAVLTGAYLWYLLHEGGFGPMEGVLAFGALSAIAAAGVQGALIGGSIRRLRNGVLSKSEALGRIALAERIAAGLIAMTIVCMVSSRYV
jgi:hypothetical protein